MNGLFENQNIFIALTYSCNAFCEKCMTRYHVNRNVEMPLNLLDEVVGKLYAHQYEGLISVGSGEPLLYPNISYFIDSILSINSKISLRILSNGKLFNNTLPSNYFSPRCKWGITMDGFSQEGLSGLQYGIDIETVKSNVAGIVDKYGPDHLYLNYTLHSHNYQELPEFCEFAVGLGIKDVYITELKVYNGYEDRLSAYQLKRTVEVNNVLNRAIQMMTESGISYNNILTENPQWNPYCFRRRKASPIIDVNGDVSFCSGREDVIIGNITDVNIEEKWNKMFGGLSIHPEKWCEFCHSNPLKNGYYSLPKIIDHQLVNEAKRNLQ